MTRHRYFALAVPLIVAAAWWHVLGSYRGWATPVVWTVTGGMAALALATAWAGWRGAGRAQLAIAASVLGLQVGIAAVTLAGVPLVSFELYPSPALGVVVLALCALGVLGLARRRVWGRWLGLALGATAVASGGLNAYNYWFAIGGLDPVHVAWSNATITAGWCMITSALGGVVIAVNLAAPPARAACAIARGEAAWTGDAGLARLVRPMLVTAFAAVPMLLVYALVQPVAPATRTAAVVLAVVLAGAAAIAVRGKLVGALVLVLAGVGLLAQTLATAAWAPPEGRAIVGYYAVFWLPAAACAVVCGVRLAGPTLRLLRRSR